MTAGFIGWLAERELPPGQRRRYHLAVARFRAWHTGQPHRHPGPSHDVRRHDITHGRRRYLAALRAGGLDHAELGVIDAALQHLCHYLAHVHNPRTTPHHRTAR